MMKSKLFWLGLALMLIISIGLYFKKPEAVQVQLAVVSAGQVELTVSNTRAGTIKACYRSRLSLPVGGQIDELLVKDGDSVKKDQVLIRLWNKDQQARLKEVIAQLAVARQVVVESCQKAELNQRERKRLAGLAAKKLVSADALDNASTQAIIAAAGCEKAKANVERAKSNVSLQHAVLEKTALTAPFAGVIAEINGEIGEYITPSPSGVATPPAVDLIGENCLYVSAPIDEIEAAKIRQGMSVNVTLDAFRGEPFSGVVTRIAPYVKELEKQARTVDIDVKLLDEEQQKKLLIGYSADIDIIIEQHKKTLRLPTEAIINGHQVLAYTPSSGRLTLKNFTPGISNWHFTEVKEGLVEGEQVLLSLDVDGAVDGAKVSTEHD